MDTDKIKDRRNQAEGLLRSALGISPLIAAAYYGAANLKANEALNLPVATSNPVQKLGESLGSSAKNISREQKKKMDENAKAAREQLRRLISDSEALQKIVQKDTERNSLLQSLAITLDDPSIGLSEADRSRIKTQLNTASSLSSTDTTALVEDVLKNIEKGASDEVIVKLNRLNSQFSEIGQSLVHSNFQVPSSGISMNPVPHANLTSKQKRYVDRIAKAVGGDYEIDLVEYEEMGQTHRSANIYKRNSKSRSFKMAIPITNTGYVRPGESKRTLYTLPKVYMDIDRTHEYAQAVAEERRTGVKNPNIRPYRGRAMPDVIIGQLERTANSGNVNFDVVKDFMNLHTTNVSRLATAQSVEGLHVRTQAEMKNNVFAVGGLSRHSSKRQKEMLGYIASVFNRSIDPGVGAKRLAARGDSGTVTSVMGYQRGSLLGKMGELVGWQVADPIRGTRNVIDRTMAPITAREQQMIGREGRFSGSHRRLGNTSFIQGSLYDAALSLAGVTDIGDTSKNEQIMQAIRRVNPFGEAISGGKGSVYVLDFNPEGRIMKGKGGMGEAYTGAKSILHTPYQTTVLDPVAHNYPMASALLEKINSGGGKPVWVSREEINLAKGYLGESSDGGVFLNMNEDTEGFFLQTEQVVEEKIGRMDKRSIAIAGTHVRKSESYKAFSAINKGNVIALASGNALKELGDAAAEAQITGVINKLGGEIAEAIVAPSDTIGKSAANMMWYLGTATEMVSNGAVRLKQIRELASQIATSSTHKFKIHQAASGAPLIDYTPLANYAEAAFELMLQKNVAPEDIGMALTGVYFGAEGKADKYGLDKTAILTAAENAYGKNSPSFQKFEEAIKRGKTVVYGVDAKGESESEWWGARSGVEARTAKFAQERFVGAGMSNEQAIDLVTDIYKNKLGFAQHYDLASNLLDMETYNRGAASATDFISTGNKISISYNDFLKKFIDSGDQLGEFLRKSESGYLLDLSQFGAGELYLPGSQAFESSKTTLIKGANDRAITVDSELGKLFNALTDHLVGMSSNPAQAKKGLEGWKAKSTELFTKVFTSLHGGKIKGSVSPTIRTYDLNYGVGMTQKALERGRKLFTQSGGSSVFQSTTSFLSQMSDLKGTQASEDIKKQVMRFFLGQERDSRGTYMGNYTLSGRHPMLTTGNITMTQTFRAMEDVRGLNATGIDDFFEQFRKSETGSELLKKHFGNKQISGFNEIADLYANKSTRRQVSAFFKDFTSQINKFTTGTDASYLGMPTWKTKDGLEMGATAAAYADADGDHAIHFAFSGRASNNIAKHMRTNAALNSAYELQIRAFHHKMGASTKGALGNIAKTMVVNGSQSLEQIIESDVQKEVGLAMSTGGLDVGLRGLHEALDQYSENPLQRGFGHVTLGSLIENLVIKSKKLPVATDLPDELQGISRRLTETGDISEMRSFLERVFAGTDFASGISVDMPDEAVQAMGLSGKHSINYGMNDFLSEIERTVNISRSRGTNRGTTEGALNRDIAEDAHTALGNIKAGTSMDSAAMVGYSGERSVGAEVGVAVENLKKGLGGLEHAMGGKLIAGALASVAAMQMMTSGVGPEPLAMPGETNSMSSLIASNSLFNRKDPQVSPESLAPQGSDYPTAPINTGQTYGVRPNSYQVTGEVSSGAGLGALAGYFSQLTGGSGRGIITINDQRRPITSNYLDRLTGEY